MFGESKVQQLQEALEAARDLLRSVGEDWWSSKIDDACQKAYMDPGQVLSWFGGMGSFNDVLICPENGYQVDPTKARELDAQLSRLRGRIHALASELCRELNRPAS